MRFNEARLTGVYQIDLEERGDERGFFARTFCEREFGENGLETRIAQCNLSFNRERGTLRGLHYQTRPAAETKLVRCTSGIVQLVVVDVRPGSATYLQHTTFRLEAATRQSVYVPVLCAVGMQTLTDNAEVAYQVSEFYAPEMEAGLRYDDPRLRIQWPLPVSVISEKDAAWPLLDDTRPPA